MGFNTELLHGTKTGDPVTGATLTPVYQSSAFFQPSAEQHEKLFHNKAAGYSYTRINNPTIAAFEERMTVLEKGVASVACASGMAAITNALLNIVGSGDEIITSTSLYGGTIDLYHDLEAFGITTIFADTNDLEDLESKITDKTRVIFAETIGNPKLDVTDIPDVQVEDVVTLVGTDGDETITIEEIANPAARFDYEMLCDISSRVTRVYK